MACFLVNKDLFRPIQADSSRLRLYKRGISSRAIKKLELLILINNRHKKKKLILTERQTARRTK